MNREPNIRDYDPKDKTRLLEIVKLNTPLFFAEREIEDFDHYLENELEKYFVIEIENEIVGAGGINFENNYKTGKISWDFMHPAFKGMGIGRKLLNHRLVILKSMKSIETISVRTSQLAYKFYEKNGFVLIEKTNNYWADGFDLYKMIYKT